MRKQAKKTVKRATAKRVAKMKASTDPVVDNCCGESRASINEDSLEFSVGVQRGLRIAQEEHDRIMQTDEWAQYNKWAERERQLTARLIDLEQEKQRLVLACDEATARKIGYRTLIRELMA